MALDAHEFVCSSSRSRSKRRHKYEVFLSFRGEDTRKSFTDHLYKALRSDGLMIPFRDEEELERGEAIKPSLLEAIEESFSAIVVLSKNYASSRWCLDELQKIIDSNKQFGLHVFPVFYEVDPSDVRHQTGSLAEAFENHQQKFAHDKVQRWREALKQVAGLAGWSSANCYESKLIDDVVEKVRSKLDGQSPLDSNDEGLVGIDAKIADFDSILANTSEEVQFIGIWGMGGLGKTTLARAVYDRIKESYEVHCFLQNVRERSSTDDGLIKLQEKLLSHLSWRNNMVVADCGEGRWLIERRLHNRKALLVLDDVNNISQLENLAIKKGWFGKGSIIIITTRDKHLLVEYNVSEYEMNFLSHDESRQLFLRKAFNGDEPKEEFLELSKTVIKSAKGLPLALKVFGSFLCGRRITEWEDALKRIPSSADIFSILKVSFDGLEDNEKNIFLDIACFFNGMTKKNVTQMLENIGLSAKIGIEVLIEKSMVTEDKERLGVHDMLQEMGKKIVFLESPDDAGKRSRIWSLEDANHVLRNKRGTATVRGIVVRFDKPDVIDLDPEAFSNMINLKLLVLSHFSHRQLNLPHGLDFSNTFEVIEWDGCPLVFPSRQSQLYEIVRVKLGSGWRRINLRRRTQFLPSFEFTDLSHSTDLDRTPNFDKTPQLQRLTVKGYTKLVDVHHFLGRHEDIMSHFSHGPLNLLHGFNCLSNILKVIAWDGYPLDFLPRQTQFHELVDLKMQHSKLKKLWGRNQFLPSLKFVDLSHSTNLIRTPNFDKIPNLQRLIFEGCTKLVDIHHSLGKHKNLVIVNFRCCKSIETLPTKLEMDCLETFVLSGCSKVKKFPEFDRGMERLSTLHLEETAISELPQSLVNLSGLSTLNLMYCKNLVCLPSDFQKLKAIKKIDISGCSKFSRLPDNLNANEALEKLLVAGTAIKEVPSSFNNLKVLTFGPHEGYAQSSSSWHCCSLLKQAFGLRRPSTSTKLIMSPFANLSSLVCLSLYNCNLDDESLPSVFDNLSSLTVLALGGTDSVEFPSGLISKLQKLEMLVIVCCPRLRCLPQLPSNLSTIQAVYCQSLEHYVCSQQALQEFIEQFEPQTRCLSETSGHGWQYQDLSDYMSTIATRDLEIPDPLFMQPTRILNITGGEVPPWFQNQSYFSAEDLPYDYATNVSFKVKKPDSCGTSEWWGIAVCLVLQNDLRRVKYVDEICWTYRAPECGYSRSFRFCGIYMHPGGQQCIIHIRFSSFSVDQQLQMVFFTSDLSGSTIEKCGWRVVCKEVER